MFIAAIADGTRQCAKHSRFASKFYLSVIFLSTIGLSRPLIADVIFVVDAPAPFQRFAGCITRSRMQAPSVKPSILALMVTQRRT